MANKNFINSIFNSPGAFLVVVLILFAVIILFRGNKVTDVLSGAVIPANDDTAGWTPLSPQDTNKISGMFSIESGILTIKNFNAHPLNPTLEFRLYYGNVITQRFPALGSIIFNNERLKYTFPRDIDYNILVLYDVMNNAKLSETPIPK